MGKSHSLSHVERTINKPSNEHMSWNKLQKGRIEAREEKDITF